MRLPVVARLSVVALTVLAATPLCAAQNPSAHPKQEPPKLAHASGYTYVMCVFGTADSWEWQWGLTPNNQYFSLGGEWITAPITKTTKFKTSQSYSEIDQACAQAKAYYGVKKDYFAACARESSLGYPYAIVSGNSQLFPFRC